MNQLSSNTHYTFIQHFCYLAKVCIILFLHLGFNNHNTCMCVTRLFSRTTNELANGTASLLTQHMLFNPDVKLKCWYLQKSWARNTHTFLATVEDLSNTSWHCINCREGANYEKSHHMHKRICWSERRQAGKVQQESQGQPYIPLFVSEKFYLFAF